MYIPLLFAYEEKLRKPQKLLLAFCANVLARQQGTEVSIGKIVHGDRFRTAKVTLEPLLNEADRIVSNIRELTRAGDAPRLFLNSHCPTCEFCDSCRETAVLKDDLSLLRGIGEKEIIALGKRGIFTVEQLSYTFRPRKRSRRFHSTSAKYYHSLKARAIRDNRIYVTGKPDWNLTGTPVYFDVEGIPDQDFYYLIGARFPDVNTTVHRSFWANERADEGQMWHDCIQVLRTLDNPQLLHYGSYETTFLNRMKKRHASNNDDCAFIDKLIDESINVLSVIYGCIYFPTYSNGLKDLASFLGYSWSANVVSGMHSLMRRQEWQTTGNPTIKGYLTTYNAEDCEALERVVTIVAHLTSEDSNSSGDRRVPDAIHTDTLRPAYHYRHGAVDYVIPDFTDINKCSYWDYQRDRVYVRSNQRIKRARKTEQKKKRRSLRLNQIVGPTRRWECPKCQSRKIAKYSRHTKLLYDLKFITGGVKRWITKYVVEHYECRHCAARFPSDTISWTRHRYGREFLAYVIHNLVELHVPQLKIAKSVNRLFGYPIGNSYINRLKVRAAEEYRETYERIKLKLVDGQLIHADETQIRTKEFTAYVWVFTSMEEVVYVWSKTREGQLARDFLKGFSGVLVSDFYNAYDAIKCPQQKCLIHLIRDLNSDILKNPFNDEFRELVRCFAALLKRVIETVDRFGLKRRFLSKHRKDVAVFYDKLVATEYRTDVARRLQQRLRKNRGRLFTFLDHDGVPWNNNNAEHAIKAFAQIRDVIQGNTNERGTRDYLILLSIYQTCVYKGIDFLDFLRSGEICIDEYIRKNRM